TPNADSNLVQTQDHVELTPAEQHARLRTDYNLVRDLLVFDPAYCTKALPGGDLLQLPAHDDFRLASKPGEKSPFERSLASENTIDGLLAMEEKLMIQLERLDGLERALQKGGGKLTDLATYLETTSEELDALFDDTLRLVKEQDRPLETAAWSFRVFLE